MTFRLFEAPEVEPSRFVGFAGNVIDRQSENRTDDAVQIALADRSARILLLRDGRLYFKVDANGLEAIHTAEEANALAAKLELGVLLGHQGGIPVIAAPAGLAPEELPDTIKAIDFRSVYIQELLGPEDLGALAQGASLLAWNQSHRFCGNCGKATEMRAGGYKRVCESCHTQHFPRTDPVVIMLAIDKDRCLLGRNPNFQPGMYSCLAGFIEPGETIEDAVRRETFEESGVKIGKVAYHASQPWPFPHTLMIGCHGEAETTELNVDYSELEDCRWFEREEVRAMVEGTHDRLSLPPKGAIASHLVRAWAIHD